MKQLLGWSALNTFPIQKEMKTWNKGIKCQARVMPSLKFSWFLISKIKDRGSNIGKDV